METLFWCGCGLTIFGLAGIYWRQGWVRVWPLLLLLIFLAGCAARTPMNVIMTNPKTGKSVYVSHSSWGWGMAGVAAAVNAEHQQQKAIEAARMMGYTDMQEVK